MSHLNFDRLRKTQIQHVRKPNDHTPSTLHRYLRRMDKPTIEGFHIVAEALDEQVSKAKARRKMQVIGDDPARDSGQPSQDTVMANCSDIQHSPLEDALPCRKTFLDCLECENARAMPRHLPLQLLVHDTIQALRPTMTAERWIADYADSAAQLEDIFDDYNPAQLKLGRDQINDAHHRLLNRLFQGDLDPL